MTNFAKNINIKELNIPYKSKCPTYPSWPNVMFS